MHQRQYWFNGAIETGFRSVAISFDSDFFRRVCCCFDGDGSLNWLPNTNRMIFDAAFVSFGRYSLEKKINIIFKCQIEVNLFSMRGLPWGLYRFGLISKNKWANSTARWVLLFRNDPFWHLTSPVLPIVSLCLDCNPSHFGWFFSVNVAKLKRN